MASRVLVRTEVWIGEELGEINVYQLDIAIENQGDPANNANEGSVVDEIKAILTKWALSWLRYEDVRVTLMQTQGG